jgi:hypothetical protein
MAVNCNPNCNPGYRLYRAGDGPRPVRAGCGLSLVSDRVSAVVSGVKRDFACTLAGSFYLCSLPCEHSRA